MVLRQIYVWDRQEKQLRKVEVSSRLKLAGEPNILKVLPKQANAINKVDKKFLPAIELLCCFLICLVMVAIFEKRESEVMFPVPEWSQQSREMQFDRYILLRQRRVMEQQSEPS